MLQKQVIVIASDHAGFHMKERLKKFFQMQLNQNRECIDLGCGSTDSVDYPLYAAAACESILNGEATHAILVCGTGVGMCMTANKFEGIRAVLGTDIGVVRLAREHNNANVLCLGGRVGPSEFQTRLMIDVFLETDFAGNNRHVRRIGLMENSYKTFIAKQQAVSVGDQDDTDPSQVLGGGQIVPANRWSQFDDPQQRG